MADVNSGALEETARLIKEEFPKAGVIQVTVDVTDEAAVNDMVEKAVAAFGSLDCGKAQAPRARFGNLANSVPAANAAGVTTIQPNFFCHTADI